MWIVGCVVGNVLSEGKKEKRQMQTRATHSHGNCKIVRSAERKGKKACIGRVLNSSAAFFLFFFFFFSSFALGREARRN